jgi:hypothetical protein
MPLFRFGVARRAGVTLTCIGFVLLFLDSCDPAVKSTWEQGFLGIAGSISGDTTFADVLLSLFQTALSAAVTAIFSEGSGPLTTVQAIDHVSQWIGQGVC